MRSNLCVSFLEKAIFPVSSGERKLTTLAAMERKEDVAYIRDNRAPVIVNETAGEERTNKRCVVCTDVIPRGRHHFLWPPDKDRSDQFCEAMNVPKAELPKFGAVSNRRICSIHYSEEQIKKSKLFLWRPCSKDKVPRLFPRGWQKEQEVTSKKAPNISPSK